MNPVYPCCRCKVDRVTVAGEMCYSCRHELIDNAYTSNDLGTVFEALKSDLRTVIRVGSGHCFGVETLSTVRLCARFVVLLMSDDWRRSQKKKSSDLMESLRSAFGAECAGKGTPMQYQYRTRRIETFAVCNDGRWESIIAFMQAVFTPGVGRIVDPGKPPPIQAVGEGKVIVRTNAGLKPAAIGEWIVFDLKFGLDVFGADAFNYQFEKSPAVAPVPSSQP